MQKIIGTVILGFGFSIGFNLFLASCNVLPMFSSQEKSSSVSISTTPNSLVTFPPQSSYDEIDLNQLPSNLQTKGTSPKSLALDAFGSEEVEGSMKEDVVVHTNSSEQVIVTITQTNLPDDSLNSIRYRIDFKSDGSEWQMEWAGQQFICQPGRGNQNWSKELCY